MTAILGLRTRTRKFSGSTAVAAICALSLALISWQDQRPLSDLVSVLLPVLLVVGWLFVATQLIEWALRVNDRFMEQAARLSETFARGPDAMSLSESFATRRFAMFAATFILLGLVATASHPAPTYWRIVSAFTVCCCFYYASYGLWGAFMAADGVSRLAEHALRQGRMNPFHPDRLGWLGFARAYADKASMFMLSGAIVLPLGVSIAHDQLSDHSLNGRLVAFAAAAAIFAWGSSTVVASLRGRYRIAVAVESLRAPLLDALAAEKLALIENRGDPADFKLLEIRERSLMRMKTNLFTELGGWKDFYSLFAAGAALWKIYDGFRQVPLSH